MSPLDQPGEREPSSLPSKSRVFTYSLPARGMPPPSHMRPEASLETGKFLVASEGLTDPNFYQTVILLIEYGPTGAMGVVINRPTDVPLSSMFPRIEELKKRTHAVYIGGPVARHRILLLVRSADRPEESRPVFADVYVSSSLITLRRVIDKEGPRERFRAYAGYAGWGPGQLDGETSRGDWLVADADAEMVFDRAPVNVWPELFRRNSGQWAKTGIHVRSLDCSHSAAWMPAPTAMTETRPPWTSSANLRDRTLDEFQNDEVMKWVQVSQVFGS